MSRQLVVGVALFDGNRVLAARRTEPADVAGGWEFPGGKVHTDESPEGAALREVSEELGCEVELTGWLDGEVDIKPGYVLRVATARLASGVPAPDEHDQIRWLRPSELDEVGWLPADLPFVDQLRVGT